MQAWALLESKQAYPPVVQHYAMHVYQSEEEARAIADRAMHRAVLLLRRAATLDRAMLSAFRWRIFRDCKPWAFLSRHHPMGESTRHAHLMAF